MLTIYIYITYLKVAKSIQFDFQKTLKKTLVHKIMYTIH